MDIKVSNIIVRYPRATVNALEIESLEVKQGTLLAVVGASGSGKTTFLKMLSGQIKCYTGNVDIAANNGPATEPLSINKHISLIYQGDALCDHFRVLDNVLIGRLNSKSFLDKVLIRHKKHDIEIALEALLKVGMEKQAFKKASELSGGQRQRVSIARAIVQQKPILLADEPVASLDPINAENIIRLLAQLARSEKMTIIVNLHQVGLVNKYFDNILGLKDGRIEYFSEEKKTNDETMVDALYG